MAETPTILVSYRVLYFARDAFEDQIGALLDDPSDLLAPWRDMEPAEAIPALRSLAHELGLDYDALVAKGHDFQRERLAAIEAGTIKPEPREPIPRGG